MSDNRFSSKSRNAVVVLGMHCSGTSALTGVLARLGCDVPQPRPVAHAASPTDGAAPLRLYEMNDSILHSGGGQWDDWQPFNPEWAASHRAEEFLSIGAQMLTEEFGTSRMFVLDDPRVCVLMSFWTRLFAQEEITPTYLHIHHNPVEVATALHTSGGLPLTYGVLLWLRHVLDAELGARGKTRCFTSHDRLTRNWSDEIARIKAHTGLVFSRASDSVDAEISDFLSAYLESHAAPASNPHQSRLLSKWVGRIFDVLEQWAEQGENSDDHATFDAVRAEMDAVAPLFGTLIRDARTAAHHKAALESTTAALEDLRARSTQQEGGTQTSISDYELQAQEMLAQLHAATADTEAARHEIQLEQAQHVEVQQALAKSDKKKKTLRKKLLEQQTALDAVTQQQLTAEQTTADLTARLSTTSQELERRGKQITELDQGKWQLQSELAQRKTETADMERQNAQSAAQIVTLTAQIEQLRTEHGTQTQENEQLKKSSRLMRVTLQKELEQKLETFLIQNRKQSDKLRNDFAKTDAEQRRQIAELDASNLALLNSTSWKITKPFRSAILLLRSLRR